MLSSGSARRLHSAQLKRPRPSSCTAHHHPRKSQDADLGSAQKGVSCLQDEVLGLEGGLAEAQAAFAALDAQMSRESQTAAKIGDRLHVRDSSTCCLFAYLLL